MVIDILRKKWHIDREFKNSFKKFSKIFSNNWKLFLELVIEQTKYLTQDFKITSCLNIIYGNITLEGLYYYLPVKHYFALKSLKEKKRKCQQWDIKEEERWFDEIYYFNKILKKKIKYGDEISNQLNRYILQLQKLKIIPLKDNIEYYLDFGEVKINQNFTNGLFLKDGEFWQTNKLDVLKWYFDINGYKYIIIENGEIKGELNDIQKQVLKKYNEKRFVNINGKLEIL